VNSTESTIIIATRRSGPAVAIAGGLLSVLMVVPAMAATSPAEPRAADRVLVSAATSLAEVVRQLAAAFESEDAARVTVNVGASNALGRQIRAGAPVDVLLSADDAQVQALGDLVRSGARLDFASNQLAVVVPDDRPAAWATMGVLAEPSVRRVAIGDPAAVPAGVYARQHLERLGLWHRLQPKLVPAASVRQALAAVEAGAVDAAVVYRTDARGARRSRVAFVVPVSEGPDIRYVAAGMRGARSQAVVERFLRFLASPRARSILEGAGFLPPRRAGVAP
jgi:molybdate transport system substrate-binding protein